MRPNVGFFACTLRGDMSFRILQAISVTITGQINFSRFQAIILNRPPFQQGVTSRGNRRLTSNKMGAFMVKKKKQWCINK